MVRLPPSVAQLKGIHSLKVSLRLWPTLVIDQALSPPTPQGIGHMQALGCGMRLVNLANKHEKQSVGRAELDGVLTAIENKRSGVWLHIVKDSETLHAKKCLCDSGLARGGGGRADPSQPMKHSIAHVGEHNNMQHSALVWNEHRMR